ncbi:endonuclease [Phycisphaera mikurensis]|uniref:Putative ribonuclease n=1 Tax=Phycisphaera mikurensis (strain NBRC 102666 / KCTC 22515 / FYK2301M01) TaxID=1142394 RepID=I0IDC6_PHYMF|nr:endonuclease [Phycisphaera mikurensis]MBB6443349.1 endonuclease I [Phycisphaera mikurensis]BAM03264.1 putative ribonuclease [Phycisphaera mikurensis NBRC 102666]
MRAVVCLVLVAAASPASADAFDAPAGFYDGVGGTGASLERDLRERMSRGHNQSRYGDMKDSAAILDADPERPGFLLTAYDRQSVRARWDGGRTWNREHVWPQSRQPGSARDSSRGNLGDQHALRPADPRLNSSRGNEHFVGAGLTGGPRRTGGGFFPGTADRGDVARSLFYSSTRYGLGLVRGEPGGQQMGDLDTLVAWHYLDTPDDFERRRNHAVYSRDLNPRFFQNNRNAYVDLPEAVWSVFVDQRNDSRLSLAGAATDADGGSARTQRETVYRGASPSRAGGTLGLAAEGVDPTYYRVTAAGVLSLTDPSGDGDATTLRAAVGPAAFDAGPAPVGYRVAGGLSATAGRKAGSLTLDNLDLTTDGGRGRGANDADDVFTYELTVLDHATASLAAGETRRSGSLDLGVVALGGPGFAEDVAVFNRSGTPGFTADLLADGTRSDDARVSAGSFGTVAGGAAGTARVLLRGDRLGSVDARVSLDAREPAFAGQRPIEGLDLSVTGRVALGGDATLDGRVDARDAAALRAGRLAGADAWTGGDFDRDADVDADDLLVFAAGFGTVENAGEAARAGGPAAGSGDAVLAAGANASAGDGSADFLYDVLTGDFFVDADGESLWSVSVTTLADASAAGSPAADWAFADFGNQLELTDRSAGAAATDGSFLFASLTAGLTADAFGGVSYFSLASDTARTGGVVLLIPEPGTLAGAAVLLVFASRRPRTAGASA